LVLYADPKMLKLFAMTFLVLGTSRKLSDCLLGL
jgi:hypothetical protein